MFQGFLPLIQIQRRNYKRVLCSGICNMNPLMQKQDPPPSIYSTLWPFVYHARKSGDSALEFPERDLCLSWGIFYTTSTRQMQNHWDIIQYLPKLVPVAATTSSLKTHLRLGKIPGSHLYFIRHKPTISNPSFVRRGCIFSCVTRKRRMRDCSVCLRGIRLALTGNWWQRRWALANLKHVSWNQSHPAFQNPSDLKATFLIL